VPGSDPPIPFIVTTFLRNLKAADVSELPEPLQARMREQDAKSAIDIVRDFLGFKVADAEDLDEIHSDLRQTAQVSTRKLRRELAAFETMLADPPAVPGALARMVAWEGNWVLDDPSDAGAARFLGELAQMLRDVLDEAG
jgi:microcystin degradation protein MlrC